MDIISGTSSNGGHPLKIAKVRSLLSSPENESTCTSLRPSIFHGNVVHISNELNLSGRRTMKLCKEIRSVDRKMVESNIRSHLTRCSQIKFLTTVIEDINFALKIAL